MKLLLLFALLSHALVLQAQSSYSAANQDTQSNEKGTHLDSGYSNKDVEDKDLKEKKSKKEKKKKKSQ